MCLWSGECSFPVYPLKSNIGWNIGQIKFKQILHMIEQCAEKENQLEKIIIKWDRNKWK